MRTSWLQADRLLRSVRETDMLSSFTLCRAGKAVLTSFSTGVLLPGKACHAKDEGRVNGLSSTACCKHVWN
jgi:hypothetical protein